MNATTSQSIRVGLFFLFGLGLMWVLYETLGETGLYRESGYTVRAPFSDLKQLKPGDDVRLAGVRIGSVTTAELQDNRAVAVLTIENRFRVPADSIAMIQNAGLLGANYVAILPVDSARNLGEGDSINTRSTADLSTMLSEFGDLGRRVGKFFDSLESKDGGLLGPLNGLIAENRERVTATLTNLQQITERINKGEGTLGHLVSDDTGWKALLSMADEIRSAAKEAQTLMADARGLVDGLKRGEGALGLLLNDPSTAERIRATVANFDDFSRKLNSSSSTLGRLIGDDSLYVQARETLGKVEKAVDSMDDAGPLTAVGIAAQAIF